MRLLWLKFSNRWGPKFTNKSCMQNNVNICMLLALPYISDKGFHCPVAHIICWKIKLIYAYNWFQLIRCVEYKFNFPEINVAIEYQYSLIN